MLPGAYVSHSTTGRIRIKVPSRKGDRAYSTLLRERFSALDGVVSVEANHLTGSILIMHKSDTETIGRYALTNNLFVLKELNSSPAGLQRRVTKAFKGIDAQIKTASGGEIDIAGMAFLVLLGFGIYQISLGNVAALPWYGAFWYALNIFLKSGQGAEVAA